MSQMVLPIRLGRTTTYLIRDTRPILIDCGMPGNEKRILEHLRRASVAPSELALIVITHAHRDHIGSLSALKAHTQAPVAIHARDADALRTGVSATLKPNGLLARAAAPLLRLQKPLPSVEPDILIDDIFDLRGHGVEGEILPTPGHTPGSISVVLESGEAIVGDLVMGGLLRPHVHQLPGFADDANEVKRSIQTLLNRGATHIHAAHGGPFTAQALRALL